MKASDRIAAELKALADLPDSEIDTSDIPEVTDWRGAVRGRFQRQSTALPNSKSPKPMSDRQKDQIRKLLAKGMSRTEIAAQVGVTPGQVSAVKSRLS
jgi:DNA-binding NarL/FixJ family response regulator